jgi:hypothetical protein
MIKSNGGIGYRRAIYYCPVSDQIFIAKPGIYYTEIILSETESYFVETKRYVNYAEKSHFIYLDEFKGEDEWI